MSKTTSTQASSSSISANSQEGNVFDFLRNSALILSWMYVLTTLFMGICVIAPVSIKGWNSYIVQGESMAPFLHRGDIIIDSANTYTVDKGSLITFSNGNGMVTHRVVEVSDGFYTTKGDANAEVDSSKIAFDEVKGDVRVIVPKLGILTIWAQDGKWGLIGTWAIITLFVVTFLCSTDTKKKNAAQKSTLESNQQQEVIDETDLTVDSSDVTTNIFFNGEEDDVSRAVNSDAILSLIPRQVKVKPFTQEPAISPVADNSEIEYSI